MDYRWRFTFQDFSPAFRANPLAEYFANIFKQRDDLCDVDSIVYQFEALGSADLKGYYNRVRSPVLILTGTEDHIHALAFALRDEIPGSELKRSEEHTSELQSLMRISYAVFCLKK